MLNDSDTIAAIATAPGEAGIAIVRVSGPHALEIADAVFRCAGARPSGRAAGTFAYGHVIAHADVAGELAREERLDEALLLVFRGPRSYTREDVVEIHGHGGSVSAARILRAVLAAGARPAEPGEFTKRAFLNGRIDLLQAEAVLDLIRARSDRAASAALEQMSGRISNQFNYIYNITLTIAADLEATLDFSEEELPERVLPDLLTRIDSVKAALQAALATWGEGHLLREGALVVIAGRPNVGKSTLLNRLLRFERAIVSEIPGTTRDTIEEGMIVNGIPVRLVDTAGLRITDCPIEQKGIDRARSYIDRADLIVYMIDASQPIDDWDRDQLGRLDPAQAILLLNKTDLGAHPVDTASIRGLQTLKASLLRDELPAGLLEAVAERLGSTAMQAEPRASISERHRNILLAVQASVQEAHRLLVSGESSQTILAAAALRTALECIGTATGRIYHNDLLESIFGRFCVGK